MNDMQKQAIEYVRNTGENASVADFCEDHEPVGPLLLADIMPRYVVVGAGGKLSLTNEGRAALT